MNKTKEFLSEIDLLHKRKVSSSAVRRMKQGMMDYVSVTVAGGKYLGDKLSKYLSFADLGAYTAIGVEGKYSLKDAVFLNGLNGHALDLDDGTNAGIIHLGSPIFSLLIPLAEKYEKTVDDVINSAILGYEVSYAMATSIQPMNKAMGYHATGTCGILGATMAAAYMLDFTEEERQNAFAAACASASGVLKVLDDGAELKPYNVAKTALLALTSLQIAKAGFIGHSEPLSGNRGYLKMMSGDENVTIKPFLVNGTYAVEKAYIKPYAACRYLHPAIEAAIKIHDELHPDLSNIEKIQVSTYSLAVSGHDHTDVPCSASAKMSIPYSVAVGIARGRAGLQEFDNLDDMDVMGLTKKVKVIADEKISERFPTEQIAQVVVTMGDGAAREEEVVFPKGEPENPLNEKEFSEKMTGLFEYAGKEKATAEGVFEAISSGTGKIKQVIDLI